MEETKGDGENDKGWRNDRRWRKFKTDVMITKENKITEAKKMSKIRGWMIRIVYRNGKMMNMTKMNTKK